MRKASYNLQLTRVLFHARIRRHTLDSSIARHNSHHKASEEVACHYDRPSTSNSWELEVKVH